MTIKDLIQERKSVRTYDGKPLSEEDRENLSLYLSELENPFGGTVEFRFLDAKENKLSSPVVVGAELFVAAKALRGPEAELACGYCFEALCLYARALGIGTVMLAGTLSRKTFEEAMELAENEVMPIASPVGYPAQKRSLREKLMRRAIKADERLPFETLFFANTFNEILTPAEAGKFANALEMVRLAPSAVNKQPWRVLVCGDTVHFFKKCAKHTHEGFDLQKVDLGIALANFDLTLREEGVGGQFFTLVPPPAADEGLEYIVSYRA